MDCLGPQPTLLGSILLGVAKCLVPFLNSLPTARLAICLPTCLPATDAPLLSKLPNPVASVA